MIRDFAAIKEKLSAIVDLDADSINNMTEQQLQGYIGTLNVTANIFAVQKERLEDALLTVNHTHVMQWLKLICCSLMQIHAYDLARDFEKQIDQFQALDSIRHEKLKAYVVYFLSTMAMLFDDIRQLLKELEFEEVKQKEEVTPTAKIRGKLLTVPELNSEKIEQMTESELVNYIEALQAFNNEFPALENGLRGSIKTRQYVFVLQWLSSIDESLCKIHADCLSEDCRNQINLSADPSSIRHEKLEISVNYFLTTLSILSTEIRMLYLQKWIQNGGSKAAKEATNDLRIEVEILFPGASASSKIILAINRMKLFLNSFRIALGDAGYKLVGASSSEAALNYLKTTNPDLFIIDEDLPEMNGYLLTKKIREIGQMAPIIFTTNDITTAKMVKIMEAGAADFIIKPIVASDVQKKVAKHLPRV